MVLSQDDEILSATLTTTGGEGDGMVEGKLGRQREKCSECIVRVGLKLGNAHEMNASLPGAVGVYKVRMKKLKKKMNKKKLYGMGSQ